MRVNGSADMSHAVGPVDVSIDALEVLASAGIPVIEDTAQAHGTLSCGRKAGTIGLIGCSSTHDRKLLPTGEGGFVLTDDSSVAEAIDNYTHLGHLKGLEHGVNCKLAAPLAALGLVRLRQLEERIAQHRAVAQRLLAALPVESLLAELEYESGSAPNYYTLVLHARFNVRAIAARLGEGGLPSDVERWGYRPLYERPVFARWRSPCPNAEALIEATFQIPVHPAMSEATLDHVAGLVGDCDPHHRRAM